MNEEMTVNCLLHGQKCLTCGVRLGSEINDLKNRVSTAIEDLRKIRNEFQAMSIELDLGAKDYKNLQTQLRDMEIRFRAAKNLINILNTGERTLYLNTDQEISKEVERLKK